MRYVYAYRLLGDKESAGDLAVCPPIGEFGEYGPLSRC
jgi:hypothetical protein